MSRRFDYTTWARKFSLRFPKYTYISIQINFWIFAFLFLTIIMHLNAQSLVHSFSMDIPLSLASNILISLIGGVIYGIILGFVDIMIERRWKQGGMGFVILLRVGIYLLVIMGVTALMRFIIWDYVVVPHFFNNIAPLAAQLEWHYSFLMLAIYTLVMSAAISFINQMNKKFGPGVLIPMLLGRYRHPREEERAFMFMDLQSSTTHAERIGHLKYSALIRDSFMDINQVLKKHSAEVYQYVGDEMVISWPVTDKFDGIACVEFFFACQDQFTLQNDYYMANYGFVPRFKAGLHLGKVTAVEVGEIKRDIAYHGDTLNTAARIQSVCNEYNKSFLVSVNMKNRIKFENNYSCELLGDITLKGKSQPVAVFSVERSESPSSIQ